MTWLLHLPLILHELARYLWAAFVFAWVAALVAVVLLGSVPSATGGGVP